MRGFIFTLLLFSLLLAISEVKSEESRKLCGLQYIRTVIYICASSRWRKHLESIPQGQQEIQCISPRVELGCCLCQSSLRKYCFFPSIRLRGNRFQLPNEQEISEESAVQNLPKRDSSGEESLQGEQLPTEGLWRSKKYSVMSRQDLQKLCCTEGCSMSDLSALC
ncbi:insulin-like peptide INSL5 [Balaenoptera acutorostrata]|uniref:Insulin-like peptide INSL5 n=1 Tax=Balaenoptera acutorostrata TaxID=9767 RepID=A0A383YPN4_BALAC|nr:insulin-like peptide INSL5 [Balaenoptera acutorostrata]